jgi:hypothetical protein
VKTVQALFMPVPLPDARERAVPAQLSMLRPDPKGAGSPHHNIMFSLKELERANGFEPSTLTLARLCSTPELRPHSKTAGYYPSPGGIQAAIP